MKVHPVQWIPLQDQKLITSDLQKVVGRDPGATHLPRLLECRFLFVPNDVFPCLPFDCILKLL